jgi:hypothetical protein
MVLEKSKFAMVVMMQVALSLAICSMGHDVHLTNEGWEYDGGYIGSFCLDWDLILCIFFSLIESIDFFLCISFCS